MDLHLQSLESSQIPTYIYMYKAYMKFNSIQKDVGFQGMTCKEFIHSIKYTRAKLV